MIYQIIIRFRRRFPLIETFRSVERLRERLSEIAVTYFLHRRNRAQVIGQGAMWDPDLGSYRFWVGRKEVIFAVGRDEQ